MAFILEKIVPWGRSLDEYIRMFDLQPRNLHLQILDCAGGPASFNTEMTQNGYSVVSCDPLYQFSAKDIAQRIQETYLTVIEGVKANRNHYNWQNIQSPEELGQIRQRAMAQFLADFPVGLQQRRYIIGELPVLPFQNHQFDLALCSHFLFTYSNLLGLDFHLTSIQELCRVAKEVRIFPLLTVSGEISPLLLPVIKRLEIQGYTLNIQTVSYEFQNGGNQMLKLESID